MSREQLLSDLRWLLAKHAETWPDADEAPEQGPTMDPKLAAIRRLWSGQTVAVSVRYLRAIVRELEQT